ncbi:hypothetical protein NC651_019803 [Populus alba x Populus x berolinensis]|nr:hypothetical protein NC651_019803 [Populus alba x Populus x berolinensis]
MVECSESFKGGKRYQRNNSHFENGKMNFLPPVMVDIGYGCVFYKHFQVDGGGGCGIDGTLTYISSHIKRLGKVKRGGGFLGFQVTCFDTSFAILGPVEAFL